MDETGAHYTEWSKSQRKTPILYINTYIWNLERRWWRPCMWDSKRDTDINNRLLDSVGEGEGGMVSENSIEACIYQMWHRRPVHVWHMRQGTQSQCTGTTQRDEMGREVGRGFRMGTYVHPWLMYVNAGQKPPQHCN